MKQKRTKKQQTEQKNIEKEVSVRKPLILYFLIVCMMIAILILIVSAICYGIVNLQGEKDKVYTENIEDLEPVDAAIVPGTAVNESSPTPKGKDRLDAAIVLYEQGLVDKIIVSGAANETKVMTQYLMIKGIPPEKLASDEKGLDTYETLTRIVDKYEAGSYYFCTQELYRNRAEYLMKQIDMDGEIICVDTMYYANAGQSILREYFAATKAVFEAVFYGGRPKSSIEEVDFVTIPEPEESHNHISAEEIETPADYRILDKNENDSYDVMRAVEYARTYALDANPKYPLFEENCTNFVSQCLVAGGIEMQGEEKISDSKRWKVSGKSEDWFSISQISESDGRRYYSTSSNFVNTNAFIQYFTEERGYELSVYENNYDGKLDCYKSMASGDVLILYNEEGEVAHIGLVTGMGNMNAYFCANTSGRLDYGAFNINDSMYPQIGILHMTPKGKD